MDSKSVTAIKRNIRVNFEHQVHFTDGVFETDLKYRLSSPGAFCRKGLRKNLRDRVDGMFSFKV